MNSQGDFVPRVEHNWTRPQHMEENASWRTAPPATVIFFNAHSGPLGGSLASAAVLSPQPWLMQNSDLFGQRQALSCFPSVLSYNTTDTDLGTQSLLASPTLSSEQVQEGKVESKIPLLPGLTNAMQKDFAYREGTSEPLLLLLSAPSLLTVRLYPKTSY